LLSLREGCNEFVVPDGSCVVQFQMMTSHCVVKRMSKVETGIVRDK
jgi:hypothetical protein